MLSKGLASTMPAAKCSDLFIKRRRLKLLTLFIVNYIAENGDYLFVAADNISAKFLMQSQTSLMICIFPGLSTQTA